MFDRALAAIAGAALLAAPAFAQAADTHSVSIKTADLDLASANGRDRLDRRVRQAAGQICGAQPRGLSMRVDHQRCHSEVMSDAETKIARMIDKSASIQVARRGD